MTSEQTAPTETDESTDTEQTTDWQTAVVGAIEQLGTASDGDTPADEAEFKLKAGRDRLAGLDASDAPARVAEAIDAAVARLEAYDNTPAKASTTAWSTLAELAPLAARAATLSRPMTEHHSTPDDRSTDTDHASDPEAIDTDVEAVIDDTRSDAPGSPCYIEIGLATYTIERIDLERDADETVPDWIRGAIDQRLSQHGVDVATTDDLEGRPDGYDYGHDTEQDVLSERLEAADRGEYVAVELDLPSAVVVAIHEQLADGPEVSVAHWIRRTVTTRFSLIDADLSMTPVVEIEVPDEIALRARFRAEHRAHRKGRNYEDTLMDALNDLVQPHPEYVLESGDVLATYADDGGDR